MIDFDFTGLPCRLDSHAAVIYVDGCAIPLCQCGPLLYDAAQSAYIDNVLNALEVSPCAY